MQRRIDQQFYERLPGVFTKIGMGSALLAMLGIAVALLVGFVRLTWTEHQINQAITHQEAINAARRRTNEQLKGQAEFSESDTAVEQMARDRLGMARDGETVLRPNLVTPPLPTPQAAAPQTITSDPTTSTGRATTNNALRWWHALFPGANARP